MTHTFQLDPSEVLGVGPTATLQEIRDAYRAKSKRHHPDQGGDEWAFRVVVRSYEILSTARVAGRVRDEQTAAARPDPSAARPEAPPPPPFDGGDQPGRARHGVRDAVDDPAKLVAVEMLLVRFEVDNPIGLLLEPAEDRCLSCSVNVAWPAPASGASRAAGDAGASALKTVSEAFDAVTTRTRVLAARSESEGGRFSGWLSYPTVARAEEGFRALRAALNAKGLGVDQWIREMAIPRAWRD